MVWAPPRESPSRSGPLPREPTPCRARVKAWRTSLPAQRRCVGARRVPAGGLSSSSRSAMTSGHPVAGDQTTGSDEQWQSGVDVDWLPLRGKTGRLPDGHRAAPIGATRPRARPCRGWQPRLLSDNLGHEIRGELVTALLFERSSGADTASVRSVAIYRSLGDQACVGQTRPRGSRRATNSPSVLP